MGRRAGGAYLPLHDLNAVGGFSGPDTARVSGAILPQAAQDAGSRGVQPSTLPLAKRCCRSLASTLPSSTPHWSKLLMPHSAPLTNTRCSCRAISAPSDVGVSASSNRKVLGRLPGNGGAAHRSRPSITPGLAPGRWPAASGGDRAGREPIGAPPRFQRQHVGALVQHLKRHAGRCCRLTPEHWRGRKGQGAPCLVHTLAVAFHLQLLPMRRQAAQARVVRGDTAAGKPRKLRYQTSSSARRTGRLVISGAVRKCSSMAWHPPAACETLGADGDGDGHADGRPE